MIKTTLTIGRNVNEQQKWTSKCVVDTFKALTQIKNFTAYNCTGFYNGIKEKSVRIEVINFKENSFSNVKFKMIQDLCNILEQESILYEHHSDSFYASGLVFKEVC